MGSYIIFYSLYALIQFMKTIIYIVLIALLGLVAWFALLAPSKDTLDDKNAGFAIKDTANIQKIIIRNRNGGTLTLDKQTASQWRVNNRFTARKDAVETLLYTFRKLKSIAPVSRSGRANVIKTIQEDPLRTIEVFMNNDLENPIKTYYLASATVNNKRTQMMLKGADDPHVVSLPGFAGQLVTRFFTDPEEWRDRTVFHYPANTIKSIALDYFQKPEHSFKLHVISPDSFLLDPPKVDSIIQTGKLNKLVAQNYIESYKRVYAEAFENGHPRIDSLQKSEPFLRITVTDTNNKYRSIDLHYMLSTKRTKSIKDGRVSKYDHDRFFGFINKRNDLVLVQQFGFGKLFRKYDDFLVKELNNQ